MNHPLTTLTLILLTLIALAGSARAIRRLRGDHSPRPPITAAAFCAVVAAALFLYRWLGVNPDHRPIESHVDGLILVAALLAAVTYYLGGRSRLPGIAAFAMPTLTLLLAWAVCASWFTFTMFDEPGSLVRIVHLIGVYLGTLFFALSAVCGGMYLFLQKRARRKLDIATDEPLPSLETAERLIVRTSALGFALLTVGLVTGLIIVTTRSDGQMGPGWWHHPKVILAASVWIIYALVMNLRHATHFRGARAAWMSVLGFVLILATLAVSQVLTDAAAQARGAVPSAPPSAPPQTEVQP